MKFKSYLINEASPKPITDDVEEIKTILQKDCKKIISAYKSVGNFLLRGEEHHSTSLILKHGRLENRKPKHTPQDVHNRLNYAFKKEFGWNVRNGVFAEMSYDTASLYGNVYYFFPVGNFKFCWSPKITDLYSDYITNMKYSRYKWGDKLDDNVIRDEIIDKYTDSNLVSAIKSRREISFNVNKYYLLLYDVWRNKINYIIGK